MPKKYTGALDYETFLRIGLDLANLKFTNLANVGDFFLIMRMMDCHQRPSVLGDQTMGIDPKLFTKHGAALKMRRAAKDTKPHICFGPCIS